MKGKSDAEGIKVEIGGFYYEQDMAVHGADAPRSEKVVSDWAATQV